jgi:outer membrane immunogenic protein
LTAAGVLLFPASSTLRLNGGLFGVQGGYNWQIDSWVLGIETDFQWTGERGSFAFVCPAGVCGALVQGPVTGTFEQKLSSLGTLRGRLGVTSFPGMVTGSPVMAYVTGGLAWGRIKSDGTLAGTNCVVGAAVVCGPAGSAFTDRTTKVGWTIGAGIEGVLWGNWSAKVEYLYVDLGTVTGGPFVTTLLAGPAGSPAITAAFNSRITDNIFRVGLNYRLDAGPVIARY